MLRLLHSAIDPKDALLDGYVTVLLQATRITPFLDKLQLIRITSRVTENGLPQISMLPFTSIRESKVFICVASL